MHLIRLQVFDRNRFPIILFHIMLILCILRFGLNVRITILIFSSPELKAQVSSEDEISPFSRLNGDWMVAECRLNGDGKGGFQSHYSRISVTIQSTEWQAHFSDLSVSFFFLKNKITPNAAWTRVDKSKGKTPSHSATGTVSYYDEYLLFVL